MSAIAEALSAALIHFVWQGALVGLLLRATLFILRHRSSNDRYAASGAALALLATLPVITTAVLYGRSVSMGERAFPIAVSSRAIVDAYQPLVFTWSRASLPATDWLAVLQFWALPVWSAGVLCFSARLVCGGAYVFVFGRRGRTADASLCNTVARVAERMGVNRPVRVLVSTLADGPSVIGWLRPIVLLPPATAMGLTPQQLEAVLAHELAHIRRHDYLVNILQMMVETVFFYHPVVWWTSKRIRLERELCCDDLAVASCGDALTYARALTRLETLRITKPRLAMGSTGGPLLYRIKRLMSVSRREYGPSWWPAMLAICLGLACVALNVSWLRAQAQTRSATDPAFEVASVKLNKSGDMRVTIQSPAGGRFTATNAPVRALIRYAYQMQDFQLDGGPGWLVTERFDVVAKADTDRTPSEIRSMVRTLLADRFRLNVHNEVRDLPVYALVVARNDGKKPAQLRAAARDCAGVPSLPPGPPNPGAPPPCGFMGPGPGTDFPSGRAVMSFRGLTLEALARFLAPAVRRPVVDRTGLTGYFDGDFEPTAEWPPPPPPPGVPDPFDRQSFPTLFTVLPEQLGLKLDSQRAPVDILVIDRIEQPTED